MRLGKKLFFIVLAVLALGVGVAFAATSGGSNSPPGDVSGPCDEAENANDPRCAGAGAPPAAGGTQAGGGVDISGPCDEAEHAND
ncbi:MAG: hypothetical protein M3188_02410, partial [Actinomycetota bacterium]|nr:hypothetical protein [Actinomycetota bacterium]